MPGVATPTHARAPPPLPLLNTLLAVKTGYCLRLPNTSGALALKPPMALVNSYIQQLQQPWLVYVTRTPHVNGRGSEGCAERVGLKGGTGNMETGSEFLSDAPFSNLEILL